MTMSGILGGSREFCMGRSRRFSATGTPVRWPLLLLLLAGSLCSAPAQANEVRFVPQLGLTDSHPVKVAFSPQDADLLMVVNGGGRIDPFDISATALEARFTSRVNADGLDASYIYDIHNLARPIRTVVEVLAGARDAAFSPAGTRIISGATVRLWTLFARLGTGPFSGHDSQVWSVAFSPNGTRIVSGGVDGSVRLGSLDGRFAADPYAGHDGGVLSVAFSPDGTRIVSGGADGAVRLWRRFAQREGCRGCRAAGGRTGAR